MKNFKIGSEIRDVLSSALGDNVKKKIFPLIAPANTTFPFIVYRRSGYTPNSNKDFQSEIVFIEIAVITTEYAESVEIANNIADTLQAASSENIEEITVTNIFEEYLSDSFIQKINISVKINFAGIPAFLNRFAR